jgi:hypothetical protein
MRQEINPDYADDLTAARQDMRKIGWLRLVRVVRIVLLARTIEGEDRFASVRWTRNVRQPRWLIKV